jgi:hypothetical protein
MGGATYTKDGAPYLTITNDPQTAFYRQHDARFLPNGDISIFDDQTDMAGPARGVVYSYDVKAGTATFQQHYKGQSTAGAMGSFRILEDGSRVLGWGSSFTELDANGSLLLEVRFTDGTHSYRSIKVPTTAFDLDVLRATAGID